jgi:hypothetical protein
MARNADLNARTKAGQLSLQAVTVACGVVGFFRHQR